MPPIDVTLHQHTCPHCAQVHTYSVDNTGLGIQVGSIMVCDACLGVFILDRALDKGRSFGRVLTAEEREAVANNADVTRTIASIRAHFASRSN